MSLPNPGVFYRAGDAAIAAKFGDRRPLFPIPRLPSAYAFEQDFMQLRTSRFAVGINTADDLNAPDDVDPNAILCVEGPGQDSGNGMERWTRIYHRIPGPWDDPVSYAYSFPGFSGYMADPTTGIIQGNVAGRMRFSQKVTARAHWDYFLLDPNNRAVGVLDSAGNAAVRVSSLLDIPQILAQRFYIAGNPTSFYDYLSDAPPTWPFATVPSRTTYEGWMAAGTELVAEDSTVSQFAGNIFGRLTLYVKAK